MKPATLAESLSPLTERGWLAAQPPAFVDWMALNGRWRSYRAGQTIYAAGEDPDALYGLGEGALEIAVPIGDDTVTIHRAEPGFWIGDSALLAETTRLVSIEAAVDARLFRVPAAAVRALVDERPEYWRCFYGLSHINLTLAVTQLAEALALSPPSRVARMILRLADGEGRVPARQEDLARLIGMTRSSLQRTLQALADEGTVARGYRSLTVLDRDRLERIAGET
jgi:CRP/FNR family cyclic AMP-dependent transcriptional regulator